MQIIRKRGRLSIVLSVLLICGFTSCFAGQLGDWNYTNSLNVARATNSASISGQYVYTIGGYAYDSTPYPIERAQILPNGALSPWSIGSTNTHNLRASGLTAYSNNYLYAIAGSSNVSDSTTVERTNVNPDGSFGNWTTISILPLGFVRTSLIQTTSYLYIIGGYQDTPSSFNIGSNIYRSAVNPDGSLGTWTLLSSQLIVARDGLMTILINSTLYVVGGDGPGGFQTINVERAYVFPDGQLSAFTTISYTVTAHYSGGLFYDGQYLNVIGGYNGGNPSYRSERALVNADGSLGAWEPAPYLLSDIAGFGYVQTTTACYVIGGSPGGGEVNSVEYVPIFGPTGIKKRQWEIFE